MTRAARAAAAVHARGVLLQDTSRQAREAPGRRLGPLAARAPGAAGTARAPRASRGAAPPGPQRGTCPGARPAPSRGAGARDRRGLAAPSVLLERRAARRGWRLRSGPRVAPGPRGRCTDAPPPVPVEGTPPMACLRPGGLGGTGPLPVEGRRLLLAHRAPVVGPVEEAPSCAVSAPAESVA